MSNIVRLPVVPIRALPNDTLRSDCERLMRRLVKYKSIPKHHLHILADVLDDIIDRVEPRGEAHTEKRDA
jgi:hypothetical protein